MARWRSPSLLQELGVGEENLIREHEKVSGKFDI